MRYEPWIDISLDNLLHNLHEVKKVTPATAGVMAVVKDAAYGHGAVQIARVLEKNGVAAFAVARTAEASSLRNAGICLPILVLGEASIDDLRWAVDKEVSFSLNNLAALDLWESSGVKVSFHCDIDTGMGRLGLQIAETKAALQRITQLPQLQCIGLFTHLACADEPGTSTVHQQLEYFAQARVLFAAAGIHPRHIHYANSAGIIRFPATDATLVRPGILLYGCNPDPRQEFGLALKPVAMLKGPVVKCKKVTKGTPLSYGHRYITTQDTTIATVYLGYAHGVPRALTNKGQVLIQGKSHTIAGTVTMDYLMVDCGPDTTVKPGDEAVVIGEQGQQCICADEVARHACTIGYEILCNLSSRIDRFYHLNGSIVAHDKGMLY